MIHRQIKLLTRGLRFVEEDQNKVAIVQKVDIMQLVQRNSFSAHLVEKLESTTCWQIVAELNCVDNLILHLHHLANICRLDRHIVCQLGFLVKARMEAHVGELTHYHVFLGLDDKFRCIFD